MAINVSVVAFALTARYVDVAASVAVTMQVPTVAAVRLVPVMVQPVAVPLVTANVGALVPEPPVVMRAIGFSSAAVVARIFSAGWGICVATTNVYCWEYVAGVMASVTVIVKV